MCLNDCSSESVLLLSSYKCLFCKGAFGKALYYNAGMARTFLTALIREVYMFAGFSAWQGIREAAKARNKDLIVLLGNVLGKDGSIVYDLIASPRNEGSINWSAADSNDLLRFYGLRLEQRPMVTITLPVENYPFVRGDAINGVKLAVQHMVEVHASKKFLCIQGRQTVASFRERYEGFMAAVKEAGIPDADVKVFKASNETMDIGYGEIVVKRIMEDERLSPGKDFEVVFCPSENVAMGVLRAFKRRGVRVPQDMSLIGVDNSFLSKAEMPKMTSTILPLYLMGKESVDLLMSRLSGVPIPRETVIRSTLEVNQSCGCYSKSVLLAGALAKPVHSKKHQFGHRHGNAAQEHENLLRDLRSVTAQFLQDNKQSFSDVLAKIQELTDNFVQALIGDVEKDACSDSLTYCDYMLNLFVEHDFNMQLIHDIVSIIYARAGLLIEGDEYQLRLKNIIDRLRVRIAESIVYPERTELARFESSFMRLRELIMAISSTFEFSELFKQLSQSLPGFGIADFYIVLYETRKKFEFLEPVSQQARVVYAMRSGVMENLPEGGVLFNTLDVLPDSLLPSGRIDGTLVPLMFKGVQMGYFMANGGPYDRVWYVTIASQISNVIQGDLIMQDQAKTKQELAKTLERLHEKAVIVNRNSHAISDQVADASAAMHEVASNIKSISNLTVMISDVVQTAVSQASAAGVRVRQLDDQLKKISEVTALISDIAERTNVLSINAGIQAARAHEAGKGFAIVAQEVRQLAEGTSSSAGNIKQLIVQVNKDSSNVIESIQTMSEVVSKVDSLSAQIQDAISQQTIASDEISERLLHVSEGSTTISSEIDKLANG